MTALGERLGDGRRGAVFARGGGVVKLFHPDAPPGAAAREAAAQAQAVRLGAPAPLVHGTCRIDARQAIAMDLAPGPVLGTGMLSGAVPPAEGLARMLRLHRAIHAVPTDATARAALPALTARLAARIAAGPLAPARRDALLAHLAALPDGAALCHGDFHPFNILGPAGDERVIDWADAAIGPPAADACTTCVLLAPHDWGLAGAYLRAYLAGELASGAAWLPLVAAARLADGLPTERDVLLKLAEGALP